MWNLPGPGIKPVSLVLQGRFVTTGPLGKPEFNIFVGILCKSLVVIYACRSICMQVKKQQLELDMEQQTDSKSGREYIKVVHCHPVYLTCMQSTSYEMPGWMKHKPESRLLGKISITSYMQMTPPLW